jgi:predicted TIM-barrel fold metal-dependent hydrolase
MSAASATTPAGVPLPPNARVVDCDVHAVVPAIETLFPWLGDHWREVAATTQFRGPTDTAYPPSAATSLRPDLAGADGVAESVADVRARALDPWQAETAILVCAYATEAVKNPDAAAALSRAVNAWVAEAWLAQEPRLRGSIVVPALDPNAAAAEVEHWAGDPRFVQVLLPVRSLAPYGNRLWWPLLDAVARHDLVLALHAGGATGNPPTSVGWPTTYIEEYVDMASAFQAQLMSLVAEGAFSRHPGLRVLCAEGGFAWLPSLMWRFDRLWRGLRREIPWTQQPPSAYLREHVRVTTQPFDGPADAAGFGRLLDQIGSADMLCFSTDYPHWQYDSPAEALPPVDDETLRGILGENARTLYRL